MIFEKEGVSLFVICYLLFVAFVTNSQMRADGENTGLACVFGYLSATDNR